MEKNSRQAGQSFLSGAFTLILSTIIVKIIGAVYKIPLFGILSSQGSGYYNTAYTIYTPIYVMATAGLPAAVAKLVAEYDSQKNYRSIKAILRIAFGFFLISGTVGAVIMFFFPDIVLPFWNLFNENSVIAVKTLAPTLLFVCLMSAFRGYYEGLRNMYPTAVSQTIEAVCKLIFGLLFANAAVSYGLKSYAEGKAVYGTVCASEAAAKNASLPYAAAGAILGVAVGAFAGLIYLLIRHKAKGDGITAQALAQSPPQTDKKIILRRLLKIAAPICLGAIALNLSGMIDNFTVNMRMTALINKMPEYMTDIYGEILAFEKIGLKDLPNSLWGLYGFGLVFYNLVPMITLNFGISALPSITRYHTAGDTIRLHENIERAVRMPALIAYPAAIGLAVMAKPILAMFYLNKIGAAGVEVGAALLQILAVTLLFGSLVTPFGSILQGLGKPEIQVKIVAFAIVIKTVINYILIGIPQFNITGAPIGTFVFYGFVFFCELYMIVKYSMIKLSFTRTFFKPLSCAIICGFAAAGSYYLLNSFTSSGGILKVGIPMLLAGLTYIVSLLLTKTIKKDDILSFPKGEKLVLLLEKYKMLG